MSNRFANYHLEILVSGPQQPHHLTVVNCCQKSGIIRVSKDSSKGF
jgi:hypothetical protein